MSASVEGATVAPTADEVRSTYGLDLTTAEVLRHALRFVSLQMQLKINTAALSPLLNEVNDFGIGLLGPRDPDRDLDFDAIAMATAAPGHYVINQFYARMAIEHFGVENFRPGDVIVYNDPYRGGSHVNDVGALMPIFDGDALMGFAVSITHWLDIGGPVPGGLGAGLQRDMYSEGIKITPRRLYREGELVAETLELFTEQTRIPDLSVNDLQVIRAALQLGADMVGHYVRRYGADVYRSAAQYTVDYSERLVRSALTRIPDGVYEAQDHLDNDAEGNPMLLRCTVRKHADRIEVDYSGTCRSEWFGYAAQWSDTVCAAHLGVAAILDQTGITPNAGGYRPIDVVVPPGSCLHALPPMSTNAGHTMLLTKALNLVKQALSQADPELAVGENYDDVSVIGFAGLDDRGPAPVPFVAMRPFSGPYGGTRRGDGCAFTLVEGGNCVEPSIELDEIAYPVLILEREFVADTAGPGENRGGPANRVLLSPQVDVESLYQVDQCRFPTKGVIGGGAGALGSITVHRAAVEEWAAGRELADPEVVAGIADAATGRPVASEDVPGAEFRLSKRAGVPFGAGDVIAVQLPGGGGYGAPSRRSDEAVRRDLRDGIYTTETRARGAVSGAEGE
ncbi:MULTISPECIES: hydantoinase B/oxoprolinase family protein [Pseudonocardia]|uniref:Acetophenone carboxylase delta subunit n=2 Tax=Pseudonocardia TaxID=1847 RepID=A0A1Y2NAH2_PSEAH|nr:MULTISPECIES: hydantoinase B/oxoprolinase family protein [Pseudonocardia]OSY44231.1 Acetophenone carboxylase delta subunit [Pseudonocardia autotrophica]TDN74039.1 N-methylhydantoinase B [Pseudonocardia autotrophica]BBG04796.1 methylhydantoinase [Pseudonocardia autotrophica]GEC23452.1 methylhydantoinase [Pseudonocardia saturnea]